MQEDEGLAPGPRLVLLPVLRLVPWLVQWLGPGWCQCRGQDRCWCLGPVWCRSRGSCWCWAGASAGAGAGAGAWDWCSLYAAEIGILGEGAKILRTPNRNQSFLPRKVGSWKKVWRFLENHARTAGCKRLPLAPSKSLRFLHVAWWKRLRWWQQQLWLTDCFFLLLADGSELLNKVLIRVLIRASVGWIDLRVT